MPSASEISTWLECKRKWSFQYQEHLRGPSTPSQDLGTETHRQLEEYYEHGTPFLFSGDELQSMAAPIAHAALEYLPQRGEHMSTEGEFFMVSPRHTYYGLVDLIDPSTFTIYDHKTTSNLKYAKTTEVLRHDVQAVLYATNALVRWETPSVNLQWTYLTTRGKTKAVPVRVTLTNEHVGTMFAIIEDVADEMEAAKGTATLELPPSINACDKYGGCPFQGQCNIGPRERIGAYMSEQVSIDDLLTRLTAKSNAVSPGQINPPEAFIAPAPVAEVDPPAVPAPVEKKTRVKKGVEVASGKPIGTLYVACIPQGPSHAFHDLLALATERLQNTATPDGKMYPDWRFIPYGQGAAVLLGCVLQALTEKGHVDKLVVTDANTPEVQICLNALLNLSENTVRGV